MTTNPVMSVPKYATKDLAMATFLSLNGLSFRLEMSPESNDVVHFVFRALTPDEVELLNTLIRRFSDGEARVEPLRFMKEVGLVRGRMYDFLDGHTTSR